MVNPGYVVHVAAFCESLWTPVVFHVGSLYWFSKRSFFVS